MEIKRMRKFVVLLGIIILIAVLFSGNSVFAQEKKYTFYFVVHDTPTEPFWMAIYKGMEQAGKDLDVETIYVAPDVYSIKKLTELLDSAIAAKPDGIAVSVTSWQALDEPLRRAIEMGIPVVALNVSDPRPPEERIPYLSYVGQDLFQAGVSVGEAMIKRREVTRSIYLIDEPGNIALEERGRGIESVMKREGIPYDKMIVGEELAKILSLIKSYFLQHPDTNTIFAAGTSNAAAAMQFIKEEGLEGKVYLGNFDLNPTVVQGIRDGLILYTIDQQPRLQGYLPILFLYMYKEFMILPPDHIETSMAIIDKNTIEPIVPLIEEGYR